MSKTLKIIGLFMVILILFKSPFYRLTIKYREIGIRPEVKIKDEMLIKVIKIKSINREMNMEGIVEIANEITNTELAFTIRQKSNDPNELIYLKRANCMGYSAMFNSIANYLIRENGLETKIEAQHKIGKLEFLGIDLHQFFENPFYKNHDYNQIRNLESGKIVSIDPSVSDYLWIKKITTNQQRDDSK
ncbi:MAG: hypothetical protein R2828_26195 [Saprospiraceae bacterium]